VSFERLRPETAQSIVSFRAQRSKPRTPSGATDARATNVAILRTPPERT
jgi:hypothetical protein